MAIAAGEDILVEDLFHIRKITCVADEDLTAGNPVGISNYVTGLKVARALRPITPATISYTVNSSLERQNQSFPIGGDKFIFLNSNTGTDTLYATVGTITPSTKAVSLGTSVAVTADETTPFYVGCKLDTDKFIVFYLEDASTTIIKYRIGTVSGTTITFGSAATFATGATAISSLVCDQISTDKGIIFYGAATVINSRLIAFTASGTVATAGTPLAIGTTIDNEVQYPMIRKVATDKFIIACDSGNTASNYCQIGTLSGTTITLGTETVFSANDDFGNSSYTMKIVSPSDNVVIIIHSKAGSGIGETVVGTISGTTPTFGTPVAGSQYDIGLYSPSSSSFFVGNGVQRFVTGYTFSGTTITSIGIVNYVQDTQCYIKMDNGYYVGVEATGTTLNVHIEGMSNNFIGIAQSTVSKGASVDVLVEGIDANQSALIPGGNYLVSSAGLTLQSSSATLNTVNDSYVLALSATQILVKI